MAKKERKTQARFVYKGLGFPVALLDVPMVRIRGHWTPDINYEELQKVVLSILAEMPARLSGNEVRFIRHTSGMTLKEFAERFGVTHPAVHKWERAGDRETGIAWSTEKDIRLFLFSYLGVKSAQFVKLYKRLETAPHKKPGPLKVDASQVA